MPCVKIHTSDYPHPASIEIERPASAAECRGLTILYSGLYIIVVALEMIHRLDLAEIYDRTDFRLCMVSILSPTISVFFLLFLWSLPRWLKQESKQPPMHPLKAFSLSWLAERTAFKIAVKVCVISLSMDAVLFYNWLVDNLWENLSPHSIDDKMMQPVWIAYGMCGIVWSVVVVGAIFLLLFLEHAIWPAYMNLYRCKSHGNGDVSRSEKTRRCEKRSVSGASGSHDSATKTASTNTSPAIKPFMKSSSWSSGFSAIFIAFVTIITVLHTGTALGLLHLDLDFSEHTSIFLWPLSPVRIASTFSILYFLWFAGLFLFIAFGLKNGDLDWRIQLHIDFLSSATFKVTGYLCAGTLAVDILGLYFVFINDERWADLVWATIALWAFIMTLSASIFAGFLAYTVWVIIQLKKSLSVMQKEKEASIAEIEKRAALARAAFDAFKPKYAIEPSRKHPSFVENKMQMPSAPAYVAQSTQTVSPTTEIPAHSDWTILNAPSTTPPATDSSQKPTLNQIPQELIEEELSEQDTLSYLVTHNPNPNPETDTSAYEDIPKQVPNSDEPLSSDTCQHEPWIENELGKQRKDIDDGWNELESHRKDIDDEWYQLEALKEEVRVIREHLASLYPFPEERDGDEKEEGGVVEGAGDGGDEEKEGVEGDVEDAEWGSDGQWDCASGW